MPAPIPVASALSYLGIAKETTKGTAVAATNYLPVLTITPQDKVTYLPDKSMRGSMVEMYDDVLGVTASDFGYGGPVYGDSVGWALAGVTGDVVTGAVVSGVSPHVMSVKNNGQPSAYTLADYYGLTQARAYAGQQFSEVALKYNADTLFTYTAKSSGWASTLVTKPTAAFTAVQAAPTWAATATIAGSASLLVETAEITLKRPVSIIHTAANTQLPQAAFSGPLSVAGKMTLLMPDDAELNRYLNGTQTVVVLDFTTGTAGTLIDVKVQMSKVQYVLGTVNRGKDFVQVDVTFDALANVTDVGATGGYSPALVTVKNLLPTGTYV